MGAHGGDGAVFHDQDQVGFFHGCHTLGDDDLGGVGDLFPESLPDHGIGVGIHRGGGVVQDQDLGLFQQSTCDTQALLLTAGNVGAALFDVGVVAIGEAADEVIGAGQLTGMDHFFVGGVGIAPAEVILDGAGEEDVLLEDHGDLIAEGFYIVVPDIDAAHFQSAGGNVIQTGNQLDQGGLGRTGDTQDAHGHTGLDVQIDVLQRIPGRGFGIAEGYVLKVDGAVGHFHHGRVTRFG